MMIVIHDVIGDCENDDRRSMIGDCDRSIHWILDGYYQTNRSVQIRAVKNRREAILDSSCQRRYSEMQLFGIVSPIVGKPRHAIRYRHELPRIAVEMTYRRSISTPASDSTRTHRIDREPRILTDHQSIKAVIPSINRRNHRATDAPVGG